MPGNFSAVLGPAYDLREKGGDVEEVRKFLQSSFRNHYPQTLTRIENMPDGQKDVIVNAYETPFEKREEIDFIGKDGKLATHLSLEQSLGLTGQSPERVIEILNWLNETSQTYLVRVNRKPEQKIETVARFDASSGGAYLNCDWDPSVAVVALGVNSVAKKF